VIQYVRTHRKAIKYIVFEVDRSKVLYEFARENGELGSVCIISNVVLAFNENVTERKSVNHHLYRAIKDINLLLCGHISFPNIMKYSCEVTEDLFVFFDFTNLDADGKVRYSVHHFLVRGHCCELLFSRLYSTYSTVARYSDLVTVGSSSLSGKNRSRRSYFLPCTTSKLCAKRSST
jgi:hypothetical protein